MRLEDALLEAMVDLEEERVLGTVRRMLAAGAEPLGIIDVCRARSPWGSSTSAAGAWRWWGRSTNAGSIT